MTQSISDIDGKTKTAVREIVERDEPVKMVNLAKEHGKRLVDKGLKSSQIRSIFGTARAIDGMWLIDNQKDRAFRELMKLKYKLAYQAARKGLEPVKVLADLLEPAIDAVGSGDQAQRQERFSRFLDFFEALLAYHRASGGDKESQDG
jgi:CRISPR-associated protein Csm2